MSSEADEGTIDSHVERDSLGALVRGLICLCNELRSPVVWIVHCPPVARLEAVTVFQHTYVFYPQCAGYVDCRDPRKMLRNLDLFWWKLVAGNGIGDPVLLVQEESACHIHLI